MSYKNITTKSLGKNRHQITLWTDDGVESYEYQNYAYEKCYEKDIPSSDALLNFSEVLARTSMNFSVITTDKAHRIGATTVPDIFVMLVV